MSDVLNSSPDFGLQPRRCLLLGIKGWTGVVAALITVVCVLAPVLNLMVPAGQRCTWATTTSRWWARSCATPSCALAMDLIWGYTGILSLGHGLFFALGGYGMGMYLMRQIGSDGQYKSGPAGLHGVPELEGTALALGA
jgi:urea transport system permease protein